MSARYHSSAPKGTFFGWNREPRSVSGKGVSLAVNWNEEIRDPVKLEHLLSTKGAEDRLAFFEYQLDILESGRNEGEDWIAAVLLPVLKGKKGDTDILMLALRSALAQYTTSYNSPTIQDNIADAVWELVSQTQGLVHVAALKTFTMMVLLLNHEQADKERVFLVTKVILPVIEERFTRQPDAIENQTDAEGSASESRKFADFLDMFKALVPLMSVEQIQVAGIDELFSSFVELVDSEDESDLVKQYAAECAAILLERIYDSAKWLKAADQILKAVHSALRSSDPANVKPLQLIADLLAEKEQLIKVEVPFIRVAGHNYAFTMDLYSPHVDWKKGYTTAHPTTGFAEAMTLQYIYENIVPPFHLLFSQKIRDEEFHSVIVNIICQSEASGDFRKHAENLKASHGESRKIGTRSYRDSGLYTKYDDHRKALKDTLSRRDFDGV